MRKLALVLLSLAICNSAMAQECRYKKKAKCKAEGYSSRDTTVLSMMGWGIGLAVAIATVCALIDNNNSSPSSSSSGGSTTP